MGLRANPTYRQRRVGAEMRKLRERAGMSVAEAAALLSMKQPQLSNIEAGRTGVSPERIRALAQASGEIHEEYVEALIELSQDAGKGWWTEYRPHLRPSYLDLAELEAGAVQLWSYEPMYIPGLLQTREYVAAIHRESFIPSAPEVRERAVEFRMQRQRVLTGENAPQLHAIIHESALRVCFGGREVMRDQLLRLIEVSRLPNVTIQVFPFDVEGRVAYTGSFMRIDPVVAELGTVLVEQLGKSLMCDDEQSLSHYGDVFGILSSLALPSIDVEAAPEARRTKDSLGLVQHVLYPLL
jgi:transcriptional regulator with XRE-family HTH domain